MHRPPRSHIILVFQIGVHYAKFTNEKQLKNVTSAVKRYDIRHAVVNDSEGAIWDSFQVHCWPTLVVIGKA